MNEREAFEQWLKKEHPHIYSGSLKDNDDSIRFKMDVDFMFMAWQASANREGYKLVPVSFLKDINSVAIDEFHKWKIKEEQMPAICEYMQDLSFYIGVEK